MTLRFLGRLFIGSSSVVMRSVIAERTHITFPFDILRQLPHQSLLSAASWSPWSSQWCSLAAAFCPIMVFALSKVSSGSVCDFSDELRSLMPTTSRSLLFQLAIFTNSINSESSVIYCSADSPSHWDLRFWPSPRLCSAWLWSNRQTFTRQRHTFFDLLRWCWLRLEHCLPPLPDSRVVYLLVTALPRHLDQMHFYILLEAPFPLGLLVRFGEVKMFWRFQLNPSYGIPPLPPCSSLYCSAH